MGAPTYNAYQLGYLAAIGDLPRKVPAQVRKSVPSGSSDWFQGYDKALEDTQAKWKWGFLLPRRRRGRVCKRRSQPPDA